MSASTRRWPAGHRLAAKVKGQDGKRVAPATAAAVVVIALLAWLLLRGSDDSGSPRPLAEQPSAGKTLEVVSASNLLPALTGVGYPVYWVGLRPATEYEVTRFEDGRTFIRYLPAGEHAGSNRPYLTVGSYARPDAVAGLEALWKEPGGRQLRFPGGGVGFAQRPRATNVYLAFPGVGTQIEVYDPAPGIALRLARAGVVAPVG